MTPDYLWQGWGKPYACGMMGQLVIRDVCVCVCTMCLDWLQALTGHVGVVNDWMIPFNWFLIIQILDPSIYVLP